MADNLRREFNKTLKQKIIPIAALQKGNDNSESLKGIDQLVRDGHHPTHAIYKHLTNLVSVFVEEVTALPLLRPAYDFLCKAEDLYSPGFPPMSPLSGSYYNHWTFFDVRFGKDQETIGDCFAALSDLLELDPVQVEAASNLCRSRSGVYQVLSGDGDRFHLKELITSREIETIIPTGFKGKPGTLVLVRLLPPLEAYRSSHIAVTTPYVLVGSTEADWVSYFDRQQLLPGTIGVEERLNRHMKHGRDDWYWSEFVFYGYVNFRSDAIFLAGFPDQPHTQPQHKRFDPRTFRADFVKQQLGD